jgi:hypothetical protein
MDIEFLLAAVGTVGLLLDVLIFGKYLRKRINWIADTPDRKRRTARTRQLELSRQMRETQKEMAYALVANQVANLP